jgi:hypothetical protein
MEDKMNSLCENNTWKLTNLPPGKKAITSKWIYSVKLGRAGIGERYKARLVARSFQQKAGVDYYEIFESVANYSGLGIDRHIWLGDIPYGY